MIQHSPSQVVCRLQAVGAAALYDRNAGLPGRRNDATNGRVDVIGEVSDLAARVFHPPPDDSELVLKLLGETTQCRVASLPLAKVPGTAYAGRSACSVRPDESPPQRTHAWMLRGADVVQLPAPIVHEDLPASRLVQVLLLWQPQPAIVNALFPSRRVLLPAMRELLDFLPADFVAVARLEQV